VADRDVRCLRLDKADQDSVLDLSCTSEGCEARFVYDFPLGLYNDLRALLEPRDEDHSHRSYE
jgi:hypothetical protein